MSRQEIEQQIVALEEELISLEADIVGLSERIDEIQWSMEMGSDLDFTSLGHERQRAIDKRRHCRREKTETLVKLHRLHARAREMFKVEMTR